MDRGAWRATVLYLLFSHYVVSNSFATPWTVAHQAPLSMGFPRQEYWSGLPFPSPRDLPDSGIKPTSPALADGFFTPEPPGKSSTVVHIQWKETHQCSSNPCCSKVNLTSNLHKVFPKSRRGRNITPLIIQGCYTSDTKTRKTSQERKATDQ